MKVDGSRGLVGVGMKHFLTKLGMGCVSMSSEERGKGVGVGVGVLYCQYRLSRKSSQVKNIIKKFKMA